MEIKKLSKIRTHRNPNTTMCITSPHLYIPLRIAMNNRQRFYIRFVIRKTFRDTFMTTVFQLVDCDYTLHIYINMVPWYMVCVKVYLSYNSQEKYNFYDATL